MLELIFIVVCIWFCTREERRFNNYMPPQGYEIDYNASSLDKVRNHLSNSELKQNIANGKYTVKSFDYNQDYQNYLNWKYDNIDKYFK